MRSPNVTYALVLSRILLHISEKAAILSASKPTGDASMTYDPAWHAEYLRLENAENAAREVYRVAKKAVERKRPAAHAQAIYAAALEAFRAAGKARWDFEMAATVIVDIATLPVGEWVRGLRS